MNRALKRQLAILAVIGIILTPVALAPGLGTLVIFMINVAIFLILAESWNFLAGYAGQISLGSAAFFGIGAYTLSLSLVWYNVPLVLALLLAGIAPALVSALIAVPMFRLRTDVFAIGTLGFSLVIGILILYSNQLGGFSGFSIIGVTYDLTTDYYVSIASILLTIGAIAFILQSKFGRAILAIRDDEVVADSLGVPVLRYKVYAFAISSFFAGISGAIYALYIFHISSDLFSITWTANAVVITIVGGMATIAGPAIMAFIYVLLQNYLLSGFPVINTFVYAGLLIGVIILLPNGLMSLYRWDRGSFQDSGLYRALFGTKKKKGEDQTTTTTTVQEKS